MFSWASRAFASLVIVSGILWPFTTPGTTVSSASAFEKIPVVQLFGFHIRLLEVLFIFSLLVAWAGLLLGRPTWMNPKRERKILVYSFIGVLFIVAVAFWGFVHGQPNVIGDMRAVSSVFSLALFFVAIRNWGQVERQIQWLLVLLAIIVGLNIITTPYGIYENIGKSSRFSVLYSILLFCLCLSQCIHGRRYKRAWFLGCILSTAPSLLTGSKWGVLGLLIAFILPFFMVRRQYRKTLTPLVIQLGLLVLLVAIVVPYGFAKDRLAGAAGYESFDEYYRVRVMHEDEVGEGDVTGGRFQIWTIALDKFSEKPMLGHGFGIRMSYYNELTKKQGQLPEHNLIVWLLLRIGIVGTGLVLWMFIRLFRLCMANYRSVPAERTTYVFAFLLFMFVFAMINFFAMRIFMFEEGIVFWFCAAVVVLEPTVRNYKKPKEDFT